MNRSWNMNPVVPIMVHGFGSLIRGTFMADPTMQTLELGDGWQAGALLLTLLC